MKVNTEIDDDDLDTRFPDPDDEDDDDPVTALLVIIRAGDGTGHKASVVHVGSDATPELIAESLVSAVHGGRAHLQPRRRARASEMARRPTRTRDRAGRRGLMPRSPADRCACGHVRNHHSGWGLGRCLVVDGCTCPGPLRTITDTIEFSVPMLPDAARRAVEAATR